MSSREQYNVCEKASALFLWHRRRKEKALQKESAVMGSFALFFRSISASGEVITLQ